MYIHCIDLLVDTFFILLNVTFFSFLFFWKFSIPTSFAFILSLSQNIWAKIKTRSSWWSLFLGLFHSTHLRCGVESGREIHQELFFFSSLTHSLSVPTQARQQTAGQSTPSAMGCTWSHVVGRSSRAAPRREAAGQRLPSRCTARRPAPAAERR